MRSLMIACALAACAGILPCAAPAQDDAGALLARSRATLGGDALERLRSVHVKSDTVLLGIKGTQEQWLDLAGNTYAEFQDAGPASGADGFDGRTPWARDASGIVHSQGGPEALMAAVDQAYLNGYALWSLDRGGATVTVGKPQVIKGVSYDDLLVTPKGGSPLDVAFDRAGFPVRVVGTLGTTTTTTTLADYRAVEGAMFPYHVYSTTDTGNAQDVHTTLVEPNPADIVARIVRPLSSAHDFSIAGGATETSLPFELIDNHAYVDVTLNGKGPYRFVFDSGGANFVDPAVLKEVGGKAQGDVQGSGVGAQTQQSAFAKVATVGLGDARLLDQAFIVAPVRQGFGVAAGKPADGLIGYEVLARFVTTYDYGARRIVLRLPGASTSGLGSAVPFTFHGNTPMVSGSIDGVPADMTVDTGSRLAISIFKPFADAHPQVVPALLTGVGANGYGIGGAALGRLGRVHSVRVGPFDVPDVIADFSVQAKGAFADPYTAANIGGAFWKRFALTFDYPHETLYLAPNASFALRETYDRSGLFLILHGGAVTALDVRPGTPAQSAGIVNGDTLEAIDGKPTLAMSLADVRGIFAGPAGTRLTLTLARGGAVRTVALVLHDYV